VQFFPTRSRDVLHKRDTMNTIRTSKLVVFPEKRDQFERIIGFEYVKEQLDPKTPFGRKYFYHLQPLSIEHLVEHLDDTEYMLGFLDRNARLFGEIEHVLECIIDISQTIYRLESKELLDEIELFELKNFALLIQSLREKVEDTLAKKFIPPSLDKVINLLDPEGLKMPTFYIYDLYDDRLKEIRKKKRELMKAYGADEYSEAEIEIIEKEREIEQEILKRLSNELSECSHELKGAIEKVRYLDVIMSKAKLARSLDLSKPTIKKAVIEQKISIFQMFNPLLKHNLEAIGKQYQPINIEIERGVTLLVGANMSGKSVVLRTVALIQYMTQLGFFVPARKCETILFDTIAIVAEDTQKPLSGLSSFAAEIKLIDEVYRKTKKNDWNSLVLIDEPARTTNPYEGTAIVNAIVELFESINSYTLVVSHFDEINSRRRLRVKGLKTDVEFIKSISDIQDYIDYQLVQADDKEVPKEAIRVMELLNIDSEFANKAREKIDIERNKNGAN